MNVHDSEKVIGTLMHEGYRQVETVEQADLILYNTCSIRDKAEQKSLPSPRGLQEACGSGQEVWRAGLRGPAGRRKDFRARAACVTGMRIGQLSQVAGNAVQLEEWEERWSKSRGVRASLGEDSQLGVATQTDYRPRRSRDRRVLRDRIHRAHQSSSRIHHHHRRLRQVLRLLRGPVHARQGAQPHFGLGAR